MHAEADALAARLVRGQAWLTGAYDKLLAMPREGWRTPEEERFLYELDRWDSMVHIHAVYHVSHCIHGEGKRCPDNAVGACLACAR